MYAALCITRGLTRFPMSMYCSCWHLAGVFYSRRSYTDEVQFSDYDDLVDRSDVDEVDASTLQRILLGAAGFVALFSNLTCEKFPILLF